MTYVLQEWPDSAIAPKRTLMRKRLSRLGSQIPRAQESLKRTDHIYNIHITYILNKLQSQFHIGRGFHHPETHPYFDPFFIDCVCGAAGQHHRPRSQAESLDSVSVTKNCSKQKICIMILWPNFLAGSCYDRQWECETCIPHAEADVLRATCNTIYDI